MLNESGGCFKGFSADSTEFLMNLSQNNNKEWFDKNKNRYKNFLLIPMQQLVMDMSGCILSIDPAIDVTPSAGKTISRIHRDTRFSKDKSPYRNNMWITFKRPSKGWTSDPTFFFEISPDSYRYGMGYYSADPRTMEAFRQSIDTFPEEFENAIAFYSGQHTFVLEGDRYKRILDKSKPERILDWYQRKNLYLVSNRNIDDILFSHRLVDEMKAGFELVSGFYHYLHKIKG